MNLLITGGAGYIGSHACVEFMAEGHDLVVVDNFSNSDPEALRRVEKISGRPVVLHEGDIRDGSFLRRVFDASQIDAVIHLAGLKFMGESVARPLTFYENNVSGSLVLFETMARYGVKKLIFSSSAAVYGDPHTLPVREDFPLSPSNPYGHSKLMAENILRDLCRADSDWRVLVLRCFNPAGAHPSGLIGENSLAIPNNLIPYLSEIAIGRLPELRVFGTDYPTADGTGVRDYVHVVDLVQAHVAAMRALETQEGLQAVNIGSGRGYSVLEMQAAFARECGREIPYRVVDRRPGDIATCCADPSLAAEHLGWRATRDIAAMCRDAWNWQVLNPCGYETEVINNQTGVEIQ